MQEPQTDLSLQDLIDCRWQRAQTVRWQRGLTGIPGQIDAKRRGQGLEFDDLRLYLEGDDVRHIDWLVTARSGRPHVRLFREERERTITVALDLTPTMFTGTRRLRAVVAAQVAAHLLWQAAATGARCAVAGTDGRQLELNRPVSGERGALSGCAMIAEMFARARVNARTNQRAQPLTPLLDWLVRAPQDAGLCVLVSALDEPGDSWQAKVADAGRRRRLALIWIRDSSELNGLPPGRYPFRRPDTNAKATIALNARRAGALAVQLAANVDTMREHCNQWQLPLAIVSDSGGWALNRALHETPL